MRLFYLAVAYAGLVCLGCSQSRPSKRVLYSGGLYYDRPQLTSTNYSARQETHSGLGSIAGALTITPDGPEDPYEPLAFARVDLKDGSNVVSGVLADRACEFLLNGLATGTYDLEVFHMQATLFRSPIEIRAGQVTSVTLEWSHVR